MLAAQERVQVTLAAIFQATCETAHPLATSVTASAPAPRNNSFSVLISVTLKSNKFILI